MKKIFSITLLLLTMFLNIGALDVYVIDAEKNAHEHNNMGVVYTNQGYYYAAIQEFKIAISLNPKTQVSSTFYNNLGETYVKIGYPQLAIRCYEDALTYSPSNFKYYQNLVLAYKQSGMLKKQLGIYRNKKSDLSKVVLGLIYMESGNKQQGISTLKEFCKLEPDLILTKAVKQYLKQNTIGGATENL